MLPTRPAALPFSDTAARFASQQPISARLRELVSAYRAGERVSSTRSPSAFKSDARPIRVRKGLSLPQRCCWRSTSGTVPCFVGLMGANHLPNSQQEQNYSYDLKGYSNKIGRADSRLHVCACPRT